MSHREREEGQRLFADRCACICLSWCFCVCLRLCVCARQGGVHVLNHCYSVMVSRPIVEPHFSVGAERRKASAGPHVMTLHVLRVETHPSTCERTKGRPACANISVCVLLLTACVCVCSSSYPCVAVCSLMLLYPYCMILGMQCPAAAAPSRCGFNLYLSFSMLHSAQ